MFNSFIVSISINYLNEFIDITDLSEILQHIKDAANLPKAEAHLSDF